VVLLFIGCLPIVAAGGGLNPSSIVKPKRGTWPTYNGDYSGRRFSPLKQIDAGNVHDLKSAWVYHAEPGPEANFMGGRDIKATPLAVDGMVFFTMPDHVWAVDGRTGQQRWHYRWDRNSGGIHIGNRGVGIYHDWLYFETPDNHLICLDKNLGKFRWVVEIADVTQQYFSTAAPLVVGNHIIVGIGGDSLDVPGFLEARDPETGAVQWHWNTVPRAGEPGADSWPDEQSRAHGGGMTWIPGTYDPELNLLYWGIGNPNPVHAAQGRKGNNLWTCSIVALNPETGKLVWGFQASPHDTHDYDNVQTPVLIDGEISGQKRKLLAVGARNGYFFLLDRTTGKNILTAPFVNLNWSKGVDAQGSPIPDPDKEPKVDGTLVIPASGGATNWFPPSFSPETGLFYLTATPSYSVFYLTDTSDRPEGYGGRDNRLWSQSALTAIDYKTGKIRWQHFYLSEGNWQSSGILTTAGKLLFTGDSSSNLIAFDPETGKILWHAELGSSISNGPMTYELDGRQYIVVGAGDTLHAFALPK
jgi:acido-empty-quinoprotein group A